MAKTNYSYEKRGRELEKQKKLDKKNVDNKEESESKSSPDNSLES